MKRLILVALVCLSPGVNAQSISAAGNGDSPAWHAVAKADVENRIRNRMRDPESTRFRNVRSSATSRAGSHLVICGEVNAKNAYGGYVGYSRFWAAYDRKDEDVLFQSLTLASEGFIQIFDIAWDTFCK